MSKTENKELGFSVELRLKKKKKRLIVLNFFVQTVLGLRS